MDALSAVLDIYEYELSGYPKCPYPISHDTPCKSPSEIIYNNMYITDIISDIISDDDCGLIETTQRSITTIGDNEKTRSCDLFNGTISQVNINRNINQFNILPQSLNFTIEFDNQTLFSSTELFNFLQSYGAKMIYNYRETNVLSGMKNMRNNPFDNIRSSPLSSIYNMNFVTNLCTKLEESFVNDTHLHINQNQTTYIKVLTPDIKNNIIVIGDLHGSFQTLVRNFFRFKKMNILDSNFKLKPNFSIVFLGDIIDRGVFSYECFVLIALLKINNPQNVYINRGNHEDERTSSNYGFPEELALKGINNAFPAIMRTFKHTHSALMVKDPITRNYIWMSHGGIPIERNLSLPIFITNISELDQSDQLIDDNLYGMQIRWNDYYCGDNIVNSTRGPFYFLGKNIISEMAEHKIVFAIRAHQDDMHNTKILHNKCENNYYNPNSKKYEPASINTLMKKNHSNEVCKGYMNSFYFEGDALKLKKTDDKNMSLMPVVTLTTCTDLVKTINRDSFAILRFLNEHTRNKRQPKCYSTDIFPQVINPISNSAKYNCNAATVDYNELNNNCNQNSPQDKFGNTYNKLLPGNNTNCPEYANSKKNKCDILRNPSLQIPQLSYDMGVPIDQVAPGVSGSTIQALNKFYGGKLLKHKTLKYKHKLENIKNKKY
jgi:hypothetical protein